MVRFAVIGTNFITEWFLKAAQACPEFTLQAIYSRRLETARAFAEKFPAPLLFDDLDALANCPEVDAVYIASPNALHAPQALKMLAGGKHVLVEKPAAATHAQVQAMAEAAQANGLVFLEAMRPVFTPGFALIRRLLPRLGTVRRATAVYCQYSSRYDRFKAGEVLNAFDPTLCNSALMDIGVYCVHPLVKLFGMPRSVQARSIKLRNGFEGQGTILMGYDDMLCEVIYSKITQSGLPSEIQGENGSLVIERFNRMDTLTLHLNGAEPETFTAPAGDTPMTYEVQAFIDAIAGRADVQDCTLASLHAAAVMDEARRQTGVHFAADDE